MVDSSGLENRYSSKQRTIEGSNPPLSFFLANGFFLLILVGSVFSGSAISPLSRARKKIRYK